MTSQSGTLINLDAIDWQSEDNPRDGSIDEQRIADLTATDPDLWPPIVVAPDPRNGRIRGIDGYARYKAALQLELREIRAFVECFPPDVRIRAFELNQTHGFPLRIPERKRHAAYLREHYPSLSDREIARQCGLSPTTVATVVQNGQDETRDELHDRTVLALSTVRFCKSFTRLQKQIDSTFLINPNRPKSVASVLTEYAGDSREWIVDMKARCADIGAFMSRLAQEIQ